MDTSYASEFIKSRIHPANRQQAVISLDKVGSANFIGLGPPPRPEKPAKPKRNSKKPRLLPQFKGQSMRHLKQLLRQQQNPQKNATCPRELPNRLNEMWNAYASSLVDWSGVGETTNVSGRLETILRMDLIGARMRILRSISTRQVGMEGIVTMETRNVFYFATGSDDAESNEARLSLVPKRGTVFLLQMPGAEVALNGSSMAFRPIDRTLRKWRGAQPPTKKSREKRGGIYADIFSDLVVRATDPVRRKEKEVEEDK